MSLASAKPLDRSDAQLPQAGAAPEVVPHRMLLDRMIPTWDAMRIDRREIHAPAAVVYAAALNADFMDAVRSSPTVRVLFAVRAGAERIATALRFRRRSAPPPAAMGRLRDMPLRGEWAMLGQDWPNEVAFGAVGRFWAGETKWTDIDARTFAPFNRPGFAKIGCNFHFRALSEQRTLVTYEARTKATDAIAQRAFLRYWRFVSPLAGVVMRSMLATIERAATAQRQ